MNELLPKLTNLLQDFMFPVKGYHEAENGLDIDAGYNTTEFNIPIMEINEILDDKHRIMSVNMNVCENYFTIKIGRLLNDKD